jgi:chemotaxis signal transduction protein
VERADENLRSFPVAVPRIENRTYPAESRDCQYITFQLSRQYFAMRSDRVRQILPTTDLRAVKTDAPYLIGTIPSNGRLIPVLDLRDRLALNVRPARPTGSVLVVALDESVPLTAVGFLVDKLSEVVEVRDSEIRGNVIQQRIAGRPYGRPKTLIELDTLLDGSDWEKIRAAGL